MDQSLAEKLSSLAGRTEAFARLEPEQVLAREVTSGQIAGVLGLVTTRPDVNVAQLARALSAKAARVVWPQVFAACDNVTSDPFSFTLASPDSVIAAITFIFGIGKSEGIKHFFVHRWKNLSLQNQLLNSMTAIRPSTLNLASMGLEKVLNEGVYAQHPLNYMLIIHLVLDAVCREPPNEITAKSFLDAHVKMAPDLFLWGGVHFPQPWPAMLERILINLCILMFTESPDMQSSILMKLSASHSQFLYLVSLDLYVRDPNQLDRITVFAVQGTLLERWLDQEPKGGYGFVLEVVAAADRLDLLSARDLLVSKFVTGGSEAVVALLDFMEVKMSAVASASIAASQASNVDTVSNPLTLHTVAAFETLTASMDIPPDRMEQLKSIQIQCLQVYPRLINFGQGHDEAILANGDKPTFPPDVEQEMKTCFQQMYENQLQIRDVITMLEQLKESDTPRDQDLFACMVHSLFDEYRFFPEYPVNALATTAVLFGSLIHFRLIDNVPLSIALRFVLESLRQPVESNMFRFGLQALFELRQRLPEFPKYCSVLLTIPGLTSQQQLYQQIKDIVYPQVGMGYAVEQNLFKSISPDLGLHTLTSEPPTEVSRDKILFLLNNLSPSNVKTKSRELAALLNKRYYGWFANYVVAERAIKEPNYHALYIEMISTINIKAVLMHCLHISYMCALRLVNHEDSLAHDKRTSLKNIGSFLGSLMLARDKPILHSNINFKLLLFEAVKFEKLPAVLPFVTKVLEKAASSRVFAPPSPWTMGIMATLSELYAFGNLKLNLKFEIEVLCNALSLRIGDIAPAVFIRSEEVLQVEQDLDRLSLDPGVSHGDPYQGQVPSQQIGQFGQPQPGVTGEVPAQNAAVAGLEILGQTEFATHPSLRRLFELAVSRSIQEVLLPVVERSASIAVLTTKELVVKDFAMEPSEELLRRAAHNVSSMLAMSISLVTAKDPFAESLAANLRQMLMQSGYGEHTGLMEEAVIAARDNGDIIISMVEAAARDKAVAEVEEALVPNYAARQRFAAESGANGWFLDEVQAGQRNFAKNLPRPIGLNPGHLLPEQLYIYDEFAVPGEISPLESDGVPVAVLEQALQLMGTAIDKLQGLLDESSESSITEVARDSPIFVLISQMLTMALRSPLRDEVMLKTSQVVVSAAFYPGNSQLKRDVLCFLLGKLCELSAITAKEVVLWIIYSDDERKYNVEVMSTLLRARLVSATEVDVTLAKEVLARNKVAVMFAAGFITETVLGPMPYSLRTEFTGCIEAFEELVTEDAESELGVAVETVLNALKKAYEQRPASEVPVKSQMGHVFAEWTRLVQHPCCTKRALHMFVYTLFKYGILNKPELLYSFVRTALEGAVESYNKSVDNGASADQVYVGVDALAKLLITILQTSEKMPHVARNQYAHSLLMVCALVLADQHENEQEEFDGRAYFRLFSTILYEISEADDGHAFWMGVVLSISQILETMQPVALPGFTSCWIALISHRHLMPRLLTMTDNRGWPSMNILLEALLRFLTLYRDSANYTESASITYRGLLRIMLVILHDFPEFLVEHWFSLCNMIPTNYVQLRNVVLSAFPQQLELPDPMALSSSQQVDYSLVPPCEQADVDGILNKLGAKRHIEQSLRLNGVTPATVSAILASLTLPVAQTFADGDGLTVSVSGYNALAVYIAQNAGEVFDAGSPTVLLCLRLLHQQNSEGRFQFISAMANQLRYPNVHTNFLSQLILSLFLPAAATNLKESVLEVRHIVTRVLLERIICNRPHPWGLMATFVQLLKDPKYKFWTLPFIKMAPEIEQMFNSFNSHITGAATA